MTIVPLFGNTEEILETFIYEALYVAPGEKPFPREIVNEPHIRKYILGMDLGKEFGFLAIEDGKTVGAVWGRFLPETNQGYGWYREDYPEVTISVLPEYRKRGYGRRLMATFLEEAERRKVKGISLSVSYGNYAKGLYESFSFRTVAERETDILMVKD